MFVQKTRIHQQKDGKMNRGAVYGAPELNFIFRRRKNKPESAKYVVEN